MKQQHQTRNLEFPFITNNYSSCWSSNRNRSSGGENGLYETSREISGFWV